MDRGIVGGSLKNQSDQIQALGALAVRVLRGERPESIPVSKLDLNVAQVDWRQIQRWSIPESRIPAGTLIRFREPSVWDQYSAYIVGASLVLLAETLLIVGLIVQRTRRHRAESQLRRSEAEVRASYDRIRDLASRLLDAQERERAHIARELHDDISQQMALLTIDLGLMERDANTKSRAGLQAALARGESISKALHELSHRLHPSKLRLIGLVPALNGLQRELSRPDLSISVNHENVPAVLPADVTLCLFRVAQEALHNALKYSGSTRIIVRLAGTSDGLVLSVTDDGVGFNVGAWFGSGLGLVSMEERVEAIGGTFSIQSHPGRGSRVEAQVPAALLVSEAPVGV
jgi:signal transduction histidine kinase